tara:strand:+ start:110 stop:472 length:363 start_codon:yes stop_codon:yes gene_type:complete
LIEFDNSINGLCHKIGFKIYRNKAKVIKKSKNLNICFFIKINKSIFLILNNIIIPTKYSKKINKPNILILTKKAVNKDKIKISIFLILLFKNIFSTTLRKQYELINHTDRKGISLGLKCE